MPFKPTPSPNCPKCGKQVYFNEQIKLQEKAWHKDCIRCQGCNKRLDPAAVNDPEGGIYCQVCYRRNFGIKGYGYGIGAGCMAE
uniref:Muscle LIM n=1 Tax=Isodiametra pulchra TaxID=504439 RepID=K9N081_ISOPU|nr:muscle LIM [Isodiametra pulchra]